MPGRFLYRVALVVNQGFNSSPHAPGVIILKVCHYVLFVSALGLSDAFFQVLPGSSIGQHVT